jgi:molecular chaperone GrpE
MQSEPVNPSSDFAPAAEPVASPATPEQLAAQVDALQLKLAEQQDAFLRAKAEGDNIRKRAAEDIAKAHKFAIESFAQELLGVRDSLEMALGTVNASPESLRAGVDLTLKQLTSAFEKVNLREVNPIGEKFDPNRHQAIATAPSELAPGTVVDVRQKGYVLAERLIRPAFVTVAKVADSA